jgi:hypothetical protein
MKLDSSIGNDMAVTENTGNPMQSTQMSRRHRDKTRKLDEMEIRSEGLLLKNWYIHTCKIYLLFIHKENLKYLYMTITTVIKKHNMYNNNCSAHECARLKTLQFVQHVCMYKGGP